MSPLAHPGRKIGLQHLTEADLREWTSAAASRRFRRLGAGFGHGLRAAARLVHVRGADVPCEVLAVEPPTQLVYRWFEWVVTLTLTPTADGSSLRMEQAGFTPDQTAAFGGAKYGWDRMLGALVTLLART